MWHIKSKALREHRHERVWTVEQLARESNVSARTIVALEKSDRAVRASTLKDLATAFKVAPQELGRRVDEDTAKKQPDSTLSKSSPSSPAAPTADARVPAPLPPLRAYGPGLTDLPRLTRLEELVAIEATLPPRPPLVTATGPVAALTAKVYQDVFTAYRVHEGRFMYVHGVVLAQRGMGHAQASICGTKSGMGARFHFVFDVAPGHEVGVTVHTVGAKETAGLQERINRPAAAIVKVVVAPDEAYAKGAGFEFFMSSTKTLRPWGLEVVEVLDVMDVPVPVAEVASAPEVPKKKARAAKSKR